MLAAFAAPVSADCLGKAASVFFCPNPESEATGGRSVIAATCAPGIGKVDEHRFKSSEN